MTQDLQRKIENIMTRNPQADDRDILFQLKQLLHETEAQNSVGKAAKNISDLIVENMHVLRGESVQDGIIKSGFDDFDARFGGFTPGEFVVIGGRPSMGKTQFLINLSLHISKTRPVLYMTLDLSEFLLTTRFISSVSGIPTSNILQHDLNEEQKSMLFTIGHEFTKRRLFIHDSGHNSIDAIRAACQKQIQENAVQVIIIDYLQLISSYSRYRNNREHEISTVSRELKSMAKDNNVCVMASSQLSRALESRSGYEGKRPILSDLRESGAIEQDADKVIFIHRPECYGITEDYKGDSLTCTAEIMVAKNRNGRTGEIFLSRDSHFTNFLNYSLKTDFSFSSKRLLEFESENESEMPF